MNLISRSTLNENTVYNFGKIDKSLPIERIVQPVIIVNSNVKLGDAKLSINNNDGTISITPYVKISSEINGYFQCNFSYICKD